MNTREETFLIESRPAESRLDLFLRQRYPAISRVSLQRLIADGQIRVNDQTVKASHLPRMGERVRVSWPPPKALAAMPEAIPLGILFEDDALLVLNKPAGLVVHPAAGHESHTLVNALLHHCAGQLSGIGGVARPGIVHRLDKNTSGCLVVAKTDAAHVSLASQFSGRKMVKLYHALVCGRLRLDQGVIQANIARHPNHRQRMAVSEGGGREAQTSYRVLERYALATLVEAVLHTGRTHQIRVHFQHLGYPVVGDEIYGAHLNRQLTQHSPYAAPRQMLHAARLGLTHPLSHQWMEFHAPWPDDFADAVDALAGPTPSATE